MAARYDFTIEQGSTFRRAFTWKIGGAVVDITDWTARLQARPSRGSSVLLLDLMSPSDQLTVGDTDGVTSLLLTDEETAELDFDGVLAVYDLELESPGGEVKRLLKGRIALALEVTREEAS